MSRPPTCMRTLRAAAVLPALLISLILATSAQAALIPLVVDLNGGQAGTSSPAIGAAVLVYFDDSSKELFWNINFTEATLFDGLGSVMQAHFHGPDDGIRLDIAPTYSALGAPMVGMAPIDANGTGLSLSTLEAELLSGQWYINLHTTAEPGGEIRGQVTVVPEPSSLVLATLACVGLVISGSRARRRSGSC